MGHVCKRTRSQAWLTQVPWPWHYPDRLSKAARAAEGSTDLAFVLALRLLQKQAQMVDLVLTGSLHIQSCFGAI